MNITAIAPNLYTQTSRQQAFKGFITPGMRSRNPDEEINKNKDAFNEDYNDDAMRILDKFSDAAGKDLVYVKARQNRGGQKFYEARMYIIDRLKTDKDDNILQDVPHLSNEVRHVSCPPRTQSKKDNNDKAQMEKFLSSIADELNTDITTGTNKGKQQAKKELRKIVADETEVSCAKNNYRGRENRSTVFYEGGMLLEKVKDTLRSISESN